MDLLETIKIERDIEAVYNLYCDSIDAKPGSTGELR